MRLTVKRLISLLLCLCLLVPVGTVFAAEEFHLTYQWDHGEITVTGYVGSVPATLEIPDSIEGFPVTAIALYAFEGCGSLNKVVLPAGLKRIEDGAFYDCSNLTRIILPESLSELGGLVFYGCSKLAVTVYDNGRYLGTAAKQGRASSAILDLGFYLANNPDLQSSSDYEKVYNHFITNGYKEYRKSSALFDGSYYTKKSPDVVSSSGDEYLRHYVESGQAEGRRASLTFDPDYYRYIRPDVYEAWPDDYTMCARHYAGHGINARIEAHFLGEFDLNA